MTGLLYLLPADGCVKRKHPKAKPLTPEWWEDYYASFNGHLLRDPTIVKNLTGDVATALFGWLQ